ncbi:MAG TPA: L,D-transpeptidase family protein [Candidatus Paceibacterota bacterium]|nr:L,D-transpeptidase family protein [Candidatus Paceibacterota bacterium]
MRADFQNAGVAYPPKQVALVGLKAEQQLQVYCSDRTGSQRFICSYPILAASSYPGPKLHEGDGQVPEGIYPIESLNPNSSFHVSLRVGYPNAFDKAQANKEGRTNLGGDIMIHGGAASVGCLAMGDEVSENLFTLAADVGIENVSVILAPVDFRSGKTIPKQVKLPPWTESLYAEIKIRLAELPLEVSK